MTTAQHNPTLYNNALTVALRHEGGYVDDPTDRGGETYKGISRVHNPDWPGWAAVDRVKNTGADTPQNINEALANDGDLKQAVADLYRERYWDAAACDQIAATDYDLAATVFNLGINIGPKRIQESLQESINAARLEGAATLTVDGAFGPKSAAALACAKSPAELRLILSELRARVLERYLRIIGGDNSQAKYANGWANRATAAALDHASRW